MMRSRERQHSPDGDLHLGGGAPQLSERDEQLVGDLVDFANFSSDTSQIPTSTNYLIKPIFECKFCGKAYQREAYLKKHLLTRQGFPDSVTCEQVKAKHCADNATQTVLLRNQVKQLKADLENGFAEKDNELKNVKAELLKFQNLYFLDKEGEPKLHHAVEQNDEEFILELIGNGADVNAVDKNGNTPLHLVMQCKLDNLLQTIQLLLAKGTDPNIRNKEMRTPLHLASLNVAAGIIVDVIKLLFESRKTGLKITFGLDQGDHTFLDYLVTRRPKLTPDQFTDIAEYLVGKGLGKLFHIRNNVYGQTPLEMSVRDVNVREQTFNLLAKFK